MPNNNNARLRQAIAEQNRRIAEHNRKVIQSVNDHNRKVYQTNKRNVDNYNREVARVNAANRQAVNNYNRAVDAHNARVRANRQRLQSEIARFNSQPVANTRHVTYLTSVQTLHRSFERIEEASERGTWAAGDELFEMAEGETANSVAALNALEGRAGDAADDDQVQPTVITTELSEIDADLHERWEGALFALNPRNPDAARQFCTSAREILVKILDLKAPDKTVRAAWPNVQLTENNQVLRREKIRFCLAQVGHQDAQLATFVDDDIHDVMELFKLFNPATHGAAGLYSFAQLGTIKRRVEGAIQFLHRIVSGMNLTPAT